MRILVAAVGRQRAGAERDLVNRYAERIRRSGATVAINALDIVEIEESRAQDSALRKQQEAAKLRQAVPAGSIVVALDERGKALTSRDFAARVARWRDDGNPSISFILGGPDGLDSSIRKEAQATFSFGAATWPHMLARVMLMEQLYRATTLLSGHPYHRD